jgi:Bacteriodetes cell division protein (FtsL-like)
MAKNIIRDNSKPKLKSNSKTSNWLGSFFSFEKYLGKEFPVHYLDRSLFLLIIGIVLVAFRINAERQLRQIRKMDEENNRLRAKATILEANMMKRGKQSQVAPKVASMGIHESKKAPYKIIITEE